MTADTSAVIAALSAWHEQHELAADALEEVRALPAHVLLEAYSVLTRLPAGLAVEPTIAARALDVRFPEPPLRLDDRGTLLWSLAATGVYGGASYDGVVALEAAEHERVLLTLDERAVRSYRLLGVRFQLIA